MFYYKFYKIIKINDITLLMTLIVNFYDFIIKSSIIKLKYSIFLFNSEM